MSFDTIRPYEPHPQTGLAGIPAEGVGFGLRTAAYVIDYIILLIVTVIGELLVLMLLPLVRRGIGYFFHAAPIFADNNNLLSYLVSFVMTMIYMALFEWVCGTTPGKLILGLRVVMDDGTPCRLWPALLRGFLRLIDGLFFGVIAYQSMKKSPENKRVGDSAANTMVIRSKNLPSPHRHFGLRFVTTAILSGFLVFAGMAAMKATTVTKMADMVINYADQINLAPEELSQNFALEEEHSKNAFSNKTFWDANVRMFRSDSLSIESRVILMGAYLNESDKESLFDIKPSLDEMFGDTQLSLDEGFDPEIGDDSYIDRFTDTQTGEEGYVVVFIRKNAFVKVVIYGERKATDYERAASIARKIDKRIVSGDYSPIPAVNDN
jgi:uncharacterized RDD family membrane protein YckC